MNRAPGDPHRSDLGCRSTTSLRLPSPAGHYRDGQPDSAKRYVPRGSSPPTAPVSLSRRARSKRPLAVRLRDFRCDAARLPVSRRASTSCIFAWQAALLLGRPPRRMSGRWSGVARAHNGAVQDIPWPGVCRSPAPDDKGTESTRIVHALNCCRGRTSVPTASRFSVSGFRPPLSFRLVRLRCLVAYDYRSHERSKQPHPCRSRKGARRRRAPFHFTPPGARRYRWRAAVW